MHASPALHEHCATEVVRLFADVVGVIDGDCDF